MLGRKIRDRPPWNLAKRASSARRCLRRQKNSDRRRNQKRETRRKPPVYCYRGGVCPERPQRAGGCPVVWKLTLRVTVLGRKTKSWPGKGCRGGILMVMSQCGVRFAEEDKRRNEFLLTRNKLRMHSLLALRVATSADQKFRSTRKNRGREKKRKRAGVLLLRRSLSWGTPMGRQMRSRVEANAA